MFTTQYSQMQSSTPPTQFLAGAWLSLSTGLAFTEALGTPNSVGLRSPINDARETFRSTVALLDKIARRGLSSGDKTLVFILQNI